MLRRGLISLGYLLFAVGGWFLVAVLADGREMGVVGGLVAFVGGALAFAGLLRWWRWMRTG